MKKLIKKIDQKLNSILPNPIPIYFQVIHALGIFAGVLGGACPGCFVGLFPAVLGLFGVTASLSVLPFYGLEIQAASIVLLIVAIFFLTKETVCKVDFTEKK